MKKARPWHPLLQKFSETVYRHDPMGLAKMGAPGDHYDSEALSILARFNEGLLHGCPPDVARPIALGIVQRAFAFWFNEPIRDHNVATTLAWQLLDMYVAANSSAKPPKKGTT